MQCGSELCHMIIREEGRHFHEADLDVMRFGFWSELQKLVWINPKTGFGQNFARSARPWIDTSRNQEWTLNR